MSLVVGITLGLALTAAQLEAFDFAASGFLIAMQMLVLPLLGMTLIVAGRRKKLGSMSRIGIAVLAASLLSMFAGMRIVSIMEASSMKFGNNICVALRAWHSQHGSYPDQLEELVPDLITKIPMSKMGLVTDVPYRYTRDATGTDYTLGFASVAFMFCSRRAAGKWRCDD